MNAYATELARSLRGAPWKVTTAQVHGMAMSPQFTVCQVDDTRRSRPILPCRDVIAPDERSDCHAPAS